MATKIDLMKRLIAEGNEVDDAQINESEFGQIVTTTQVAASTTLTEAIRISPPSGSEVLIPQGARLFLYIGDGTGTMNAASDVSITRERANGSVNRIASGLYDMFDNLNDEQAYRFTRSVRVTAADRLLINIAPVTTTTQIKFSLDALIIMKRGL